jgi:hypothetical protein
MEREPASKAAKSGQQQSARSPEPKVEQALQPSLNVLLQLQSSAGNQAVQGLLRSGAIQAKLRVSQPGDGYEQEADQVAEQVMRMPDGPSGDDALSFSAVGFTAQRKCAVCEEEEKTFRRIENGGATDALTSAPPVVHNALRVTGEPLDAATRGFFEPRFGRDFGDVRIHTHTMAAQSAREVGARAYTVGPDIAFALGQYAPTTKPGRRLLAHELAHVAQQRRHGVAAVQRQVVHGATPDEERFVDEAIQFIESGAAIYGVNLLSKGVVFEDAGFRRQLSGWKETLEKSQGVIDSALGRNATLTHNLRSAYHSAVRGAVAFAANRLNETSHTVYQTYRELIADWVLPHGAPEPTGGELSETLPEAERKKLTVITSSVSFDVEPLFSTKIARTTIPLPAGVTPRFGSGVPVKFQDGLRNVAGTIIPKPLALDSTMTLALDIEPYGGDYSAYRFTYIQHRPKTGTATQDVLIERLGAIGLEELTKAQVTAAQQKFGAHGFKRGSGWSDLNFESLLAAILLIPNSILSPVDGITFSRDRADMSDPEVAGNYNPDTHTITIFDRAFAVSQATFGEPGVSVSTDTVRAVVHEIGHAVDLLPLRQAWDSLQQKQQIQTNAVAQYEAPPGSGTYRFPNTEQAKWKKLSADITAAENALAAARSESGERYKKDVSGRLEIVEGGTAAGSIEFRQAAQKDGGKRLTAYSNKEWQEYYAESFSLYMTDPGTLQRLRPNVHAFFSMKHPK